MTFPLAPGEPGLTSRLHALIGEARRRARRRRARYGAFVLAALALAGGMFFQIHGGGGGTPGHARNSVKGSTEPGTVLLATRLIPKGTSWSSIAANNLFTVTTIPKGQIAPRAISDPAVLQGRVAAGDIYQHQQLTMSDFTTPH